MHALSLKHAAAAHSIVQKGGNYPLPQPLPQPLRRPARLAAPTFWLALQCSPTLPCTLLCGRLSWSRRSLARQQPGKAYISAKCSYSIVIWEREIAALTVATQTTQAPNRTPRLVGLLAGDGANVSVLGATCTGCVYAPLHISQ